MQRATIHFLFYRKTIGILGSDEIVSEERIKKEIEK